MTGDGPIPAGVADAAKLFTGNMDGMTGYTLNSATPTMNKTGSVITSKLDFSADIPTMFMSVIGKSKMTVTGSSTATASMPLYIDFYLLLDNSPSMGVGATPSDVATMVANTSDKCAFACHDKYDPHNYYKLAKKLGVTTRIDVLRSATQQLMDTATDTQTYSNQFRMAIYDFGAAASSAGLRALYSLSSNLSSAKAAAGNIDLMTVNGQNDNNDQDTNYTDIFPAINSAISAPGSGTSSSPLKYLFFVSDGVADEDNSACLKPMTSGTRCQSPIDPALCKTIKNRGIKIAVLYTTYLALPTNNWYNDWIAPFNAGPYGPSPNSEIAQNMKACASHGPVFRGQPDPGHCRSDERAVQEGDRRRADQQLTRLARHSGAMRKHRTRISIPGLVLAHHPGMTVDLRPVIAVDRDIFLGEVAGQHAVAALAEAETDLDLNLRVLHRVGNFLSL